MFHNHYHWIPSALRILVSWKATIFFDMATFCDRNKTPLAKRWIRLRWRPAMFWAKPVVVAPALRGTEPSERSLGHPRCMEVGFHRNIVQHKWGFNGKVMGKSGTILYQWGFMKLEPFFE